MMFSRLGQFFANNTSVLAPEAVTAFEQLGMPKTANMLRASIQFFGTLYPRDRVIREQRITRAVWIRCYSATGIGRLHGGRNRRRKRWLLACRKQLCARALTNRLLCPKASCLSQPAPATPTFGATKLFTVLACGPYFKRYVFKQIKVFNLCKK